MQYTREMLRGLFRTYAVSPKNSTTIATAIKVITSAQCRPPILRGGDIKRYGYEWQDYTSLQHSLRVTTT